MLDFLQENSTCWRVENEECTEKETPKYCAFLLNTTFGFEAVTHFGLPPLRKFFSWNDVSDMVDIKSFQIMLLRNSDFFLRIGRGHISSSKI